MQHELSIIIPAFNEEALLPRTLASVQNALAGLDTAAEIIVVDNNSTDATAQVALGHGATRVVFEPHNQIARARNAGAAAATAPFLVFLDADTELPPRLLALALNALRSGNHAGGGAAVATDRPFPPAFRFVLEFWMAVSRFASMAAGSFVFCRRDAFVEVGGFPETVYAGEEIHLSRDLNRWAREHGQYFTIIPAPPVVTSARKADWFGAVDLFLQCLVAAFPAAARSRRLCWMWYRRPAESPACIHPTRS